jgi:hypothetical protein
LVSGNFALSVSPMALTPSNTSTGVLPLLVLLVPIITTATLGEIPSISP